MISISYSNLNFIYAGQASQNYNLKIASFDKSKIRYVGGSSMDLVTDKASRSLQYELLDSTPGSPLEFDLEIVYMSDSMHPRIFSSAKAWLCGQLTYQPLVIQHPDFEGMHFNCILNNPEDIIANGYNGLKVTAICDSGGAWHNIRPVEHSILNGSRFFFYNESHSNDYMYPTVDFTMANGATSLTITNNTDNNRATIFTGLLGGESITMKENGEIISSTGLNRVGNFNKNYLRFKRGVNEITCSSGGARLVITPYNFVRIGGG